MSTILTSDKILRDIIKNLNLNIKNKVKPLEDKLNIINKNILNFEDKKGKVFDLYEEGIISKDVLTNRLGYISNQIEVYLINRSQIEKELQENNSEPITFDKVKQLLQKFNDLIRVTESTKQKLILQLIINKITINNNRELDSIALHFNRKIEKYLLGIEEDGTPSQVSSSFSFTIVI
ncbi:MULTISPECIES: hypothetical protein [Bacillus]|uniref:hypothetical protein n=1 Tax=Bacillus TaxID=1386 RepID=UPI00215B5EFB|nr:hypothetical protein [Bacillus pseudomycoides]MCR8859150.1 hypothetical protein [Bacillus pseudomycoides]